MKWLRIVAALLVLVPAAWTATAAQPALSGGQLELRDGEALLTQPFALNGAWHFFPGRWVTPAELDRAAADAGTMRVPGAWRVADNGINTYWLQVRLDSAVPHPSTLLFSHVCGAATVYFAPADGSTIAPLATVGRLGRDAASEVAYSDGLSADIPPLQPGIYNLLILQSNFHLRVGGLCGDVTWGLTSAQTQAHALDTVKNTVVATLLLGLALGSLMLGSQNGERAAPWLALMCIASAILVTINGGLLATLLPPDSAWLPRIGYSGSFYALVWLPPALLMVFRHTFAIALPRWFVLLNTTVPLLLMGAVLLSNTFIPEHPESITVIWCTQISFAFATLGIACRRRRQYAYMALLASIPLLLATLYDNYRFFVIGVTEMLTPYAIAFLAAAHCAIYTLKFGTSYQLAARLSTHLQEEVDLRTRELREKNHNLEQAQNALQRANESLRELSITDGLTRVYNRMYFEQQFEREWRRCARQGSPLSVLMIDADHFKQLNDSAGHLVGDLCLQSIARQIQDNFKRSGEVVARYGGEEFIVLLPDTNQNQALAMAEGLRTAIEHLSVTDDEGTSYRVTISIGVSTTVPSLGQRPEQLIATADAALYEAKDAGRNRVHSIPIITARTTMAQQKLHL